jgi:hypothetical protein
LATVTVTIATLLVVYLIEPDALACRVCGGVTVSSGLVFRSPVNRAAVSQYSAGSGTGGAPGGPAGVPPT